jgi:hypothetical protein
VHENSIPEPPPDRQSLPRERFGFVPSESRPGFVLTRAGKGLHFAGKSGNIGQASFPLADFSRVDI